MSEDRLTFCDPVILISSSLGAGASEGNVQKSQDTCGVCKSWVGRCLKGKIGKIACTEGCELFSERD